MVPPASHRVPRVPWYSGSCRRPPNFVYGIFTLFDLLSQNSSTIGPPLLMQSSTPRSMPLGLAFFPFARRYLGNRFFFLFLPLLRCFSSRRSPCKAIYSLCSDRALPSAGFPHSDISGSLAMCASPKLFAAFCVLHRSLMARQPPFALLCLTLPSLLGS